MQKKLMFGFLVLMVFCLVLVLPAAAASVEKIAFYSDRGSIGENIVEIFVMNPDGTGETRLTTTTSENADPVWSPDGSKIAFSSDRDGNYEIYVMNSDGTQQTRITTDPAYDGQPTWSPDGSKIAFISTRNGYYWVQVLHGHRMVQR
jgi:Tol biopolymer transport system component